MRCLCADDGAELEIVASVARKRSATSGRACSAATKSDSAVCAMLTRTASTAHMAVLENCNARKLNAQKRKSIDQLVKC